MGHYRKLQEIAEVEKVIKYKQGNTIDNDVAYWVPNFPKGEGLDLFAGMDVKFKVQGVCAALTCKFLFELLQRVPNSESFDTWPSFRRDTGTPSRSERNQTLYDGALSYQIAFDIDLYKASEEAAVRNLAAKMGLKLSQSRLPPNYRDPRTPLTFEWSMFDLASRTSPMIAAWASFDYAGTDTDHALGLGCQGAKCYVFDANLGGYRMPRSKLLEFFTVYKNLTATDPKERLTINDQVMGAYWFELKEF